MDPAIYWICVQVNFFSYLQMFFIQGIGKETFISKKKLATIFLRLILVMK